LQDLQSGLQETQMLLPLAPASWTSVGCSMRLVSSMQLSFRAAVVARAVDLLQRRQQQQQQHTAGLIQLLLQSCNYRG
jgi:hypothetical protein